MSGDVSFEQPQPLPCPDAAAAPPSHHPPPPQPDQWLPYAANTQQHVNQTQAMLQQQPNPDHVDPYSHIMAASFDELISLDGQYDINTYRFFPQQPHLPPDASAYEDEASEPRTFFQNPFNPSPIGECPPTTQHVAPVPLSDASASISPTYTEDGSTLFSSAGLDTNQSSIWNSAESEVSLQQRGNPAFADNHKASFSSQSYNSSPSGGSPAMTTLSSHAPPSSQPSQPSQQPSKGKRRRRNLESNRVAAKKCRQRCKSREDTLVTLEQELKGKNKELSAAAGELQEMVLDLKHRILAHASCENTLIQEYISRSASQMLEKRRTSNGGSSPVS